MRYANLERTAAAGRKEDKSPDDRSLFISVLRRCDARVRTHGFCTHDAPLPTRPLPALTRQAAPSRTGISISIQRPVQDQSPRFSPPRASCRAAGHQTHPPRLPPAATPRDRVLLSGSCLTTAQCLSDGAHGTYQLQRYERMIRRSALCCPGTHRDCSPSQAPRVAEWLPGQLITPAPTCFVAS